MKKQTGERKRGTQRKTRRGPAKLAGCSVGIRKSEGNFHSMNFILTLYTLEKSERQRDLHPAD